MKKLLFILIIIIPFMSCISIDTEIIFKTDYSGDLIISYTMSKNVYDTGKIDPDDRFFPLPVEESKYREMADNTDGLEFKSYKMKESNNETIITIKYEFKNIESLNYAVTGSSEKMIDVRNIDGRIHYSYLIYKKENEINTEAIELINSMFADYYYKISVSAPSSIKESNMGNFNGKKAVADLDIAGIISSDIPLKWEIVW